MKSALERVLWWFFPRRCALCGAVVAPDEPLCPDCQTVRPIARPKCLLCGHSKKDCRCKGKRHEYAGVTAPFVFDGSVRTGIHNLKFHDFPMLAAYMGDCMAATVHTDFDQVHFDYVVPVPLGKRRRRKRGYNQAELLARRVAEELQIPFAPLLAKVRNNPAQHDQGSARFRRVNVYGAYAVTDDSALWDKTVLLIDDVKTTGATLNECAKMLRMHGAKAVYAAAVAVAGDRKEKDGSTRGRANLH